jgi:hypothetical protein
MDIFSNLNRMVLEPKVFAIVVKSPSGQAVHIGVHFSLEDAYAAASRKMETLPAYKPGEPIDIDLWNSLSARQVVAQLVNPLKIDELLKKEETAITVTASDQKTIHVLKDFIQDMKETKSDLMKKLIEDGNVEQVEKLKNLIDPYSRKYILKEIKKKNIDKETKTILPKTPQTHNKKKK